MDELTFAATAVWHEDLSTAENWFDLVVGVVDMRVAAAAGADLEWDSVRADLLDAAAQSGFAAVAEQFVAQVESYGEPLDVVQLMSARRTDLGAAYAAAVQAAYDAPVGVAGAEADDPANEDPAVWNEYLATNGPMWDGTEDSWPAFRDWFVYYAGEQGVGGSALAFCDFADAGDKRQVFAEYVVVVGQAEPAPDAEMGGSSPAIGTEDAEIAAVVEQVMSEVGDAVLEDFREDDEFADLSDEEVRELLAEVVREFADGGS
jgi:hypothetical protein